ncbi:formylglycine-generating enzyme family protein [Colwellia psychrerythraea]|uniref:Sulphatase-modifying factor protein n=1 Tax=Colwellia psychrerythraea TaxID=28229 RepID=A0A099L667_COLPS|nr:SUMF1/EgtB/PvdO family nonheme iron enzyme [Colwellia psychrerythraea]KGJ97930.1 Sulphatase-modifying factor protein [Colwellia psychrerythraea]
MYIYFHFSKKSLFSIRVIGQLTVLISLLSFSLISNAQTIEELTKSPVTAAIDKSKKQRVFSLPNPIFDDLMKNMVLVEAGGFSMGSNSPKARNREQPVKQVTLDAFYIGKYELTQDIFEQIMGWNNSFFSCDKCPVNNISWFNMMLFIERLNSATGKTFSLPTEAQWAYAAKGGNKSKNYNYSGSNNINDVAWFAKNANNKSHAVGLKKPNELGLYDMTGNLWEFCLDDMSRNTYSLTTSHNPFLGDKDNLKGKALKVIRGGGYEFSADENLVFMRDGATNNVRMADIGFRLVMSKE